MERLFNIKYLTFIALLTSFMCSCDSNEKIEEIEETGIYRGIVINEGQFGYGTSSLTLFTHDGQAQQDVFRKVNSRPMGDVAQSMTRIGDNLYVPLNNSKKLEVFNHETFKSVETISIDEDVIPMYVQHLGGDSIAVTDQMWRNSSSKLMIIDINHGTERPKLRRTVKTPGQTFQMQLTDGKLFVAGTILTVFDLGAITEDKMRYIYTDGGETIQSADFSKLVKDRDGMLWTLTEHWLYRINPKTEKVISTVNLSGLKINARIGCLDSSPDGATIYFNSHTRVYTVDIDNIKAPTEPIINPELNPKRNTVIYHMCVSKQNTIFMNDVVYGSLSRAIIHEFDPVTGEKLNEFKAGIFPHAIFFK
ncbi:MAG: DUF5074 domain-containing protein [Marinifilaceae bacterium]